jgi:hypothetical protein
MSRVFKTRHFSRWMRKTPLADAAPCAAAVEMASGLVDADLGGGIVKKRVTLPGAGKSGGARVLVATQMSNRWFFLFGLEKNERANVSSTELEAPQRIGADLLRLNDVELATQLNNAALTEICDEEEN